MKQSSEHSTRAGSVPARYSIHNFEASENAIHVRLKQHGVRFIILISRQNLRDSPSQVELFQNIWQKIQNHDTHLPEVWEYIQDAIEPFEPTLDDLAPFTSPSGPLTLADLDKGKFYNLVLESVNDLLRTGSVEESTFVPDDDDDDSLPPEEDFCFARRLNTPFPIFALRDVEVCYKDPKRVYLVPPSHVMVAGQCYFFKACHFYDTTAAEIAKHSKIFNANLPTTELRCVRLFALVEDKDGYVHGMLYHCIDEYMPLSSAVKDKTLLKWSKEDLRQKWADQIRKTVDKLHEIGVVWGDVKAQNVLIDQERDAWVIDLEGGTTRGWVDKEKQGTLEGDAQGMERLMDFIFNDECPLRIEEEAPWDEGSEGGEIDRS